MSFMQIIRSALGLASRPLVAREAALPRRGFDPQQALELERLIENDVVQAQQRHLSSSRVVGRKMAGQARQADALTAAANEALAQMERRADERD